VGLTSQRRKTYLRACGEQRVVYKEISFSHKKLRCYSSILVVSIALMLAFNLILCPCKRHFKMPTFNFNNFSLAFRSTDVVPQCQNSLLD